MFSTARPCFTSGNPHAARVPDEYSGRIRQHAHCERGEEKNVNK